DSDHVGPIFLAGLVECFTTVSDAGVGDDDVQPAEFLDSVVDHLLQGVEVADVDLRGDDTAIESLDQFGCLGEVFGGRRRDGAPLGDGAADVDGDDVGALLGEFHSVTSTLTARSARDESYFSFNASCHVRLFPGEWTPDRM